MPGSLKILTDDLFDELGISAIIKYVKSHMEYHGLKLPNDINSVDALNQYTEFSQEIIFLEKDLFV